MLAVSLIGQRKDRFSFIISLLNIKCISNSVELVKRYTASLYAWNCTFITNTESLSNIQKKGKCEKDIACKFY